MIDLNQFYAWQAEKPKSRRVKIEIENANDARIFVYDSELFLGHLVTSIEGIDLEGEAQEKEIQKYRELRAKFADEIGEAVQC